MKIFYLGTVCSEKEFNKTVKKSTVKPSSAPQVYESALLKGLKAIKDIELSVHSCINVASYPNGFRFFIPYKKDILENNIITKWHPAINLGFIKFWGFTLANFYFLFIWLVRNKNTKNKVILCYSVYSWFSLPATVLGRLFSVQTVAIITDLPTNHFISSNTSGIRKLFSKIFVHGSVKYQNKFDKYIFLTESMNQVFPGKPNIVVEGIIDSNVFGDISYTDKYPKKVLMYAGGISEAFRVNWIVDAFLRVKGDYELWIYGSGPFENKLLEYTNIDSRIKFFGRVPREEVLKAEMKASLLINIRNTRDSYTLYSFPSKTIEYMASGTPLLTTKLPGIPQEYYEYVYTLDNENIEELSKCITKLMELPQSDLIEKGDKARTWVTNNKNCFIQGRRIYDFCNNIGIGE